MESNEDELDKYFYNLDRYKSHDFLYKIDVQDYDEIMAHFDATKSTKKYLFKDKIRKKITKILTLDKLDSVFFTDKEIYIKNFIRIAEKDGGDRRACGVEPTLLEEYKNRYFFDDSWKSYTFEFLEFVIEDTLNFRKLNPYEFKKIFISVFINMMELIVIEKTVIKEAKNIKGFSLYLLREMFDEFLLHISENLLFHFSNQDKKAIAFISFFNVNETIDANGIKYKANPILDAKQHAWNMTTIRSTMLQYKNAKQDTYNKKSTLLNQKKKLKEYNLELKVLERLNEEKSLALSEIEIKIKSNQKNIEIVRDTKSSKIRFLDNGVEKVYEKKLLVTKLFKKEDEFLNEKKFLESEIKDIDISISNKKKDIDIWSKKYNESEKVIKAIELKGHPIDKQYKKLKEALAKTLAKR